MEYTIILLSHDTHYHIETHLGILDEGCLRQRLLMARIHRPSDPTGPFIVIPKLSIHLSAIVVEVGCSLIQCGICAENQYQEAFPLYFHNLL